jgi:hypothetical protein
MSQRKPGAQSNTRRFGKPQSKHEVWSGLILSGLFIACTYQPLTNAEKAGLGAAGAEPILGEEDTTNTSTSSMGGSGSTSASAAGGSGGTVAVSSGESTSGSGSSSSGGIGGSTANGSGGSGGDTGSTGGIGGTAGTAGVAGSSQGGSSGNSGSGGISGTGGTSQVLGFRYLRLVAQSSQNGNPFSSVAELEILDANGQPLDNSGWTASADSEEMVDEMAPASNAIDSDPDTFWHTEWGTFEAPLPHYLQVDLGTAVEIAGFVYTPRQDGQQNGWILDWELYLSNSASDPGTPVDSGSFATGSAPKTVSWP